MSSPDRPTPEMPLVELLARVDAGELPLAAAVPALAASPGAAAARRRFLRALRRLRLPPGHPLPWVAVAYGLDRAARCAPRDVARAARLTARLSRRAPERRLGALQRAQAESRNPALLDALIAEGRRALGGDPEEALGWLELAALVVRRLAGGGYPAAVVDPAGLRLAAHRANALRVAGELAEADRRYRELRDDPRHRALARLDWAAELLSLEASLRIDRREFAAAEALLERAERLYGQVGDREGVARVLLQRGSAAVYAGDPVQAAEHERRAERLLDADADPRLRFLCRTNLADTLVNLNRPAEAAALLAETRDLLNQLDDPAEHLRWRWVEARIARAEERWDDAERRLLEVRNGWLASGRPYDAALATLDLAELDLARGDWAQVRRRAALLAPIFEARGVHREARAALLLFQRAAAAERVSGGLIARLRRYLHFARRDRTLRFDPAAG